MVSHKTHLHAIFVIQKKKIDLYAEERATTHAIVVPGSQAGRELVNAEFRNHSPPLRIVRFFVVVIFFVRLKVKVPLAINISIICYVVCCEYCCSCFSFGKSSLSAAVTRWRWYNVQCIVARCQRNLTPFSI